MTSDTLTEFFMWCSILNGGLLLFWAILTLVARDWVYRVQHFWIPISRETFEVAFYGFLGFFKILFIVFNLVPWLALLLMR
jgi:hypothetical protein